MWVPWAFAAEWIRDDDDDDDDDDDEGAVRGFFLATVTMGDEGLALLRYALQIVCTGC